MRLLSEILVMVSNPATTERRWSLCLYRLRPVIAPVSHLHVKQTVSDETTQIRSPLFLPRLKPWGYQAGKCSVLTIAPSLPSPSVTISSAWLWLAAASAVGLGFWCPFDCTHQGVHSSALADGSDTWRPCLRAMSLIASLDCYFRAEAVGFPHL
jgi:hypothetical protein